MSARPRLFLLSLACAHAWCACSGRVTPLDESLGSPDAATLDAANPEAAPDAASDAAVLCVFGGSVYGPLDVLTGPDGCNCMCMPSGRISCSGHTCEADSGAASCDYFGQDHPLEGDPWSCSDGCNSCYCALPGAWATTMIECPAGITCDFQGEPLPQGMHAIAPDGCNLCTCWGDGSVSCTTSWFCID